MVVAATTAVAVVVAATTAVAVTVAAGFLFMQWEGSE